ncbi:beta-mannosidase [Spirochaetia bacterium]|nr:beta-mannosidase [Spirochaetia bacterium]
MKQRIKLDQGWQLSAPKKQGWLDIEAMPMGVHEILHSKKLITDDFLIGEGESLKWAAEQDWTYRCTFKTPEAGVQTPGAAKPAFLYFEQLDTIVTVVLNGKEIGRGEDMYISLRLEVTGKLKTENLLELHFQSPYTYMKENPLPPEWEGKMTPWKVLRKPITDFSNYLGAQPYLTLMGVFGNVYLELTDGCELTAVDTETLLSNGYHIGALALKVEVSAAEDVCARISIFDPKGKKAGSAELSFPKGKKETEGSIGINNPALWWPRGYGPQNLYTVETKLIRRDSGEELDSSTRKLGFRELKIDINFDLRVNGRKVRMWGSNLAPIDGKSHRWNGERAKTILDLFEMANMNTLRIWGEGEPYADELYEECDRRGILVWQEFFGSYGMLPDTPAYLSLCRQEAEYQIRRLKHHPCIFMWCGGNEVVMGGEYDHPGEKVIGLELYTRMFPEICARLDPGRFFHITSPYGGAFANDPRTGDSHGYEMWWYVPGMEYPVAFTEHMRVSGPALKSVKRWIPEDKLWDRDFVDATYPSKRQKDLMPAAWFHRVGNSLDTKSGPVHEFRDADTPYELAYKYAAAHAKSFKNGIKRSRMGRPSWSGKNRISNAHLIWKFADTWPLIYSGIVDYYLEPFIPYYEAKRSYEPVICCFDIRDSITLWLVNDSITDSSGTLEYGLFTPRTNQFPELRKINAAIAAGQSAEIITLDDFGQFRSENILYARYTDKKRGIDYINLDYVDVERRLIFPEAKLSITVQGDVLTVTTDQFARCVELSGNDNGDEFGFYFEDNYFDLLPGIAKKIRINGRHKAGTISAKAHFSPHAVTARYTIK